MPSFAQQTGSANPFNGINFGAAAAPLLFDFDGDEVMDALVTPQPMGACGNVLNAPSVPPVLVKSIGAVFKLNLDGQGATTTMLPLNVVFFQRLAWVEQTPL